MLRGGWWCSGANDQTYASSPPSVAQVQYRPGVGDRRVHLARVADDARVGHQPGAVGVVEAGDLLGVEPGERLTEGGPLAQDRDPGEPGLEGLEGDPLEEGRLAVDRDAPLVVVVGEVLGCRTGPGAARAHRPGRRAARRGRRRSCATSTGSAAASSIRPGPRANSRAVTRSEAGGASRPSGSGRGTISSRHTTVGAPGVGGGQIHVGPAAEHPSGLAHREPGLAVGGGSQLHDEHGVEEAHRPQTGEAAEPPPQAGPGLGSVRIEVSGIQRPYAPKSVSVSQTAPSGVGTVRRTSTAPTQARSGSAAPSCRLGPAGLGWSRRMSAWSPSAMLAWRTRDSSSSRSPISRRIRSMTASTWLIR